MSERRYTGELFLNQNEWFVKYKESYPANVGDSPIEDKLYLHTLPVKMNRDDKLNFILSEKFKEGKKVKFEVVGVEKIEIPPKVHESLLSLGTFDRKDLFLYYAEIQEQIDTIKIGEGCFGPYIQTNGINLQVSEYSKDEDIEQIKKYKLMLLNELIEIYENLDSMDLQNIAQIIVSRGDWEEDESEKYNNQCDQCGNYNWGQVWIKYIDNGYQYIYKEIDNNQIKYLIYNSDHPIKLVEGKIIVSRHNDLNDILYAGLILCSVVLIVIIVLSSLEEKLGLKLDKSFDYALSWFIKCEFMKTEEIVGFQGISTGVSYYYYHAFGKLVYRRSVQGDQGAAGSSYIPSIGSLRKLKMQPDFLPKREIRDSLIKKILK